MNRLVRNSIGLFLLLAVSFSYGQKEYPVKWMAGVEQNSAGEATLVFTANIQKGWHIYSQFTPDGGPQQTVFSYSNSKNFELKGKTTEPEPDEAFDKDFGVKVMSFTGNPVFRQKIKVTSKARFTIPIKN